MSFLPFRRQSKQGLCLSALLLLTLLSGSYVWAQAAEDPAAVMERVKDAVACICEYSCILSKRELVGSRVIQENGIVLKVKRPGRIRMEWTQGSDRGRVAVYVEGRNDDKIIVRTRGFLGYMTVMIDPRGKRALKENRHTIMEVDLAAIFARFVDNYERSRTDPECAPVVASLKDPDVLEIKAAFPARKGYYAHAAVLTVDRRSWLPTGLICYGWSDEFLEEYHFDRIAVNPGFTDRDFERDW